MKRECCLVYATKITSTSDFSRRAEFQMHMHCLNAHQVKKKELLSMMRK
jgi:hypothetical protein